MKKAMSNVDVAAIVAELQTRIAGGFFGKAYQSSGDAIWLTIQAREGRLDIILEAGRRAHVTRKERVVGRTPPQFPAMLRSRLSGGRIVSVEQHDFDRVMEICVERSDGRYRLVVELFPKGNMLLLDDEMRIILPLRPMSFRDRKLIAGEQYVYHAGAEDPRSVSIERLEAILHSSDADLVRTLVRNLNMGGTYGEEVCLRAGVDKNTPATALSEEEIARVHSALRDVFDIREIRPQIVYRDGEPFDVIPFRWRSTRGSRRDPSRGSAMHLMSSSWQSRRCPNSALLREGWSSRGLRSMSSGPRRLSWPRWAISFTRGILRSTRY